MRPFRLQIPLPVSAALTTAALGVLLVLTTPPGADLPAQLYRANLFAHGLLLWDGRWYGGHYLMSYSVLTPALATLVGPRFLSLAAAAIASGTFAAIVQRHFGRHARSAAFVFAVVVLADVVVGRTAFALGQAFALASVLALLRRRRGLAAIGALLAALASPVAGLLLALAAAAAWLHSRDRPLLGVAAAAALPVLALAIVFPDGGTQPFRTSSFIGMCAVAIAAYVLFPKTERVLRTGTVLYALACVAAYTLPTPLGSNVLRLGMLFAGPILLATRRSARRALVIAAAALPMVVWQAMPAINAMARATDDASLQSSYYAPLLRWLATNGGTAKRIEIPPTLNHWESAYVAPHVALARGWERQLDVRFNPIFYGQGLTASRYRRWLNDNAVSVVALADTRPDFSSTAETALIRTHPRFLKLVWHNAHWQVFRVVGATPLATGPARVPALYPSGFEVVLGNRSTTNVRVRYSSLLTSPGACISPTPNGWTRIAARPYARLQVHAEWPADPNSACSATGSLRAG